MEEMISAIEAIYQHSNDPDGRMNTLMIIAHLMVEDSGDRLQSAELMRTFEHGRLKINVHFRKADYKNER